jgi:hypothetical protein
VYLYNIEKKEEKALAQPTNQSIWNQWTDLLAAENRHINNIAHSEETSIEKHFFLAFSCDFDGLKLANCRFSVSQVTLLSCFGFQLYFPFLFSFSCVIYILIF